MIGPSQFGARKRVVVVGSGGRLGSALLPIYQQNFEVTGLARADLDLGDVRRIHAVLDALEFDYLILAAGMTAVDQCETSERDCYAVNAEAPGVIARICAAKGAHLTCFSTDFVFDGFAAGAYTEDDIPNPLSVYGSAKLEGERQVLAADPAHLVVRLSWLYGCRRPAFPEWIIGQASQQPALTLPSDKVASPTCCEDIIAYLQALLRYDVGRPNGGIVHLCNSGECSWQEWGQACLDYARAAGWQLASERLGATRLAEVAGFLAMRPARSVLSTAKFTALTGIVPRPWREALDDHLARTLAMPANLR
jgi:dTDP-4-dehydrorhamnose reductase